MDPVSLLVVVVVPRVLSIVSAQTQTGLDTEYWGMNATAVNGDVDE